MRHPEADLFGYVAPAPVMPVRKIGYAARPGTGPRGQRCNTCTSAQRVLNREVRSWKCEQMAPIWHLGACTDIHPGAPACSEWSRKQFKPRGAE